jgi:hypothetical protein
LGGTELGKYQKPGATMKYLKPLSPEGWVLEIRQFGLNNFPGTILAGHTRVLYILTNTGPMIIPKVALLSMIHKLQSSFGLKLTMEYEPFEHYTFTCTNETLKNLPNITISFVDNEDDEFVLDVPWEGYIKQKENFKCDLYMVST